MTRKTTITIAMLAASLSWAATGFAADKLYQGVAKVSLYRGIGGVAVTDLTGSANYPNNPSDVRFVTEADVGSSIDENYGGKLEFIWTPKTGGSVQMAISTDDHGALYVSTDENPANLKVVATEPDWNGVRSFGVADRRPGCGGTGGQLPCENITQPFTVVAGNKYYVELLWKEGGGGDNAAIGVLPAGETFDASSPVIQADEMSVVASDIASIGAAKASPTFIYVGKSATLTVTQYVPPAGSSTIQWFKDGAEISGATSTTYTYQSVAADANKTLKFTAKQTAAGVTLESTAANLQVIDPGTPVYTPGFLQVDIWSGLSTSDNSLDNTLLADPRYPASPDLTSFTSSFSSRPVYPDDSHEGYGGRISGFIVPTESGDYRFFIYSDDSSRLSLSTDDKPAGLQQIAEETGCCNNFTEPDSPRTSEPQTLVAGKKYYVEALWKEGTGGDYMLVAWRKEGDTTAAGSLPVIPAKYIAANTPPGGVTLNFDKQPIASANVEVGKAITLSAHATAFPIDTVGYQWQKDGVDIAGATGTSYTLPLAVVGDVGKTAKYHLVATTLGSVKATSTDASITVVPDTFPPTIARVGTVKKGANVEIGITFNEGVEAAEAGDKANYTVSAGTIASARTVFPKGSKLDPARVVLVVSGLTAGQSVTVTAKNVKDRAGNAIPAASPASGTAKVSKMTWVGVGGDEINVARSITDYSDDVVGVGESKNFKDAEDFDLVSGGSADWDAYDEGTFVYEEITGDFDRAVRVEYQDPTSQWSRAAIAIREALDEGTLRDDTVGGVDGAKPMSRNMNVRISAPVQASGAVANNLYECIDRNITGGVYRGTPGGFGGAPNYPTAWMRIARVGKLIHYYKSDNGTTWTEGTPLDWQDDANGYPALAAKVYVGMFYAPEYFNNDVQNILTGSAITQYRDYGAFPLVPIGGGGGDPGTITIANNGTVTVTWDTSKGGKLQSATTVTGPWAAVAGATSPYTVTTSGAAAFYRLSNQ